MKTSQSQKEQKEGEKKELPMRKKDERERMKREVDQEGKNPPKIKIKKKRANQCWIFISSSFQKEKKVVLSKGI